MNSGLGCHSAGFESSSLCIIMKRIAGSSSSVADRCSAFTTASNDARRLRQRRAKKFWRFREMRVLFAFAGGRGPLEPLLPLAHAVAARGHAVAVTGRPASLPKHFEPFPAGTDAPQSVTDRPPLVRLDRTREEREFR